jgi:hypothetical protein
VQQPPEGNLSTTKTEQPLPNTASTNGAKPPNTANNSSAKGPVSILPSGLDVKDAKDNLRKTEDSNTANSGVRPASTSSNTSTNAPVPVIPTGLNVKDAKGNLRKTSDKTEKSKSINTENVNELQAALKGLKRVPGKTSSALYDNPSKNGKPTPSESSADQTQITNTTPLEQESGSTLESTASTSQTAHNATLNVPPSKPVPETPRHSVIGIKGLPCVCDDEKTMRKFAEEQETQEQSETDNGTNSSANLGLGLKGECRNAMHLMNLKETLAFSKEINELIDQQDSTKLNEKYFGFLKNESNIKQKDLFTSILIAYFYQDDKAEPQKKEFLDKLNEKLKLAMKAYVRTNQDQYSDTVLKTLGIERERDSLSEYDVYGSRQINITKDKVSQRKELEELIDFS